MLFSSNCSTIYLMIVILNQRAFSKTSDIWIQVSASLGFSKHLKKHELYYSRVLNLPLIYPTSLYYANSLTLSLTLPTPLTVVLLLVSCILFVNPVTPSGDFWSILLNCYSFVLCVITYPFLPFSFYSNKLVFLIGYGSCTLPLRNIFKKKFRLLITPTVGDTEKLID